MQTFDDQTVRDMLHGAVEVAVREDRLQLLEYWLGGDSPQPDLLYSTDYLLDDDGVTGPLSMLAAQYGQTKILQMLLASGLNPNLPSSCGQTPLSVACQEGHLEVVRLLLSHQADISEPDWEFGMEPIHYAADSGHLHIIRFLHEQGAAMQTVCTKYPAPNFDPEVPRNALSDHTSLHDMLTYQSGLLTHQTPLMIARQSGHDSLVEFLQDPTAARQQLPLKCEPVPSVKERSSEPLSVRAARVGVSLRCIPPDLSEQARNGADIEKKQAKVEIHKIQKYNQQLVSRAEKKAKK